MDFGDPGRSKSTISKDLGLRGSVSVAPGGCSRSDRPKFSKFSKFSKIFKIFKNFQKFSKIFKIFKKQKFCYAPPPDLLPRHHGGGEEEEGVKNVGSSGTIKCSMMLSTTRPLEQSHHARFATGAKT